MVTLVIATTWGCADAPVYRYKLYPGPSLPPSELATLELTSVGEVVVDGLTVRASDYQRVDLLPGRHRVEPSTTFGFSVLVEPAMTRQFDQGFDIDLAAGHTYSVRSDRTYGQGYQVYFWVEDARSGAVVAGRKKP